MTTAARQITAREAAEVERVSLAAPDTYSRVARAILDKRTDSDTKAAATVLVARLIPSNATDANTTDENVKEWANSAVSLAKRRAVEVTKEEPRGLDAGATKDEDDEDQKDRRPALAGSSAHALSIARPVSTVLLAATHRERIEAALSLLDDAPTTQEVAAAALDALADADDPRATLASAVLAAGTSPLSERKTRAALDAWTTEARRWHSDLWTDPNSSRTTPRTGGTLTTRPVYAPDLGGALGALPAAGMTGASTLHPTGSLFADERRTPLTPHARLALVRSLVTEASTPEEARKAMRRATRNADERWSPTEARRPNRWTEEALEAAEEAARMEARTEAAMTQARSATAPLAGNVLALWTTRLPVQVWSWSLTTPDGTRLASGTVENEAHAAALRSLARNHAGLAAFTEYRPTDATTEATGYDRNGQPVTREVALSNRRAEALAGRKIKSSKPAPAGNRRKRTEVNGGSRTA